MDAIRRCCRMAHSADAGRRMWLKAAVSTVTVIAGLGFEAGTAEAAALTKEKRDSLTPDEIIELMKKGNARFRSGHMQPRDFLAQKRATTTGQYPAAVILSCIDSRAPAEIILDAGIGDTFNARVAGNVANPDILGSLEFACAVSGAKVVLVMGHTSCGATFSRGLPSRLWQRASVSSCLSASSSGAS